MPAKPKTTETVEIKHRMEAMMRRRLLSTVAFLALLAGCASPQVATPTPSQSTHTSPHAAITPARAHEIRVPVYESGGTPIVEVAIAGVCCAKFVVDSGAADVTVSPGLFKAMVDAGLVTKADLIDVVKYRTASGHVINGLRFTMPPMSIGGHVVNNVIGSVSPTQGAGMLLGGSFLRRFKSFAIDLTTSELVLVAAKVRL